MRNINKKFLHVTSSIELMLLLYLKQSKKNLKFNFKGLF
jgi:hypothetical protein